MEEGICGPHPQKKTPQNPNNKQTQKEDLGICRLASLTSALGKIMEQVLLELISEHMQRKKETENSQRGFTNSKSCVTHWLL